MGDYWTNPVRHPEDTGIQYLRRTITFDSKQGANGLPIGALEAGAVPLGCDVTIVTAFNAVSSNALVIGTVGNDDGFADNTGTVPGTPGFKQNLVGADSGVPLAADTVVYAKYTQTGTAATAGKAVVVLKFAPKREGEGVPFPNN